MHPYIEYLLRVTSLFSVNSTRLYSELWYSRPNLTFRRDAWFGGFAKDVFGGPKNELIRVSTWECEQMGGFDVFIRVLETLKPLVRDNLHNCTLIRSKVSPQ